MADEIQPIQPIKPKRQYHRITPEQVAAFKALERLFGNGSAAVRSQTPTIRNPRHRAFVIRAKANKETAEQFVDTQLQSVAIDAINRIGELVASPDEKIALRSSMYAVDHVRGQATKKSIALTGKLNIQNVLD